MSWIRAAWDGPFKTPQQNPITVGWVLLKLFETIWRGLLILLLLLALTVGYLWWSASGPLLLSQVHVELSDNPADRVLCRKGYPIFTTVRNESDENVGEVSLTFKVYPQGKSEDVAIGSYIRLHDILRPRQSIQYCFPMPQLEAGAVGPFTVTAEVTNAEELPKGVPLPPEPPPIVTVGGPPIHPAGPPQTIGMKIIGGIVVMICFVLGASGGFGLMALSQVLFGFRFLERFVSKQGDNFGSMLFLAAILNLAVVLVGSWGLTVIGADGWMTKVDTWSWAHGLSDAGLMLVTGVAAQWSWVIWLAFGGTTRLMQAQSAVERASQDSLGGTTPPT